VAGNDEIKPRIMTSASGRERFSCARVSSIENSRSGIYEIVISGDFWSRAEPLETASLSLDFQVRLPQVLLSEDGMETLRDHLVTWLDDQLSFECMISPELNFDQILAVALGSDPGLISSRERPVFIVSYSRGATMVGRWAFVVDQSCVRNFLGNS